MEKNYIDEANRRELMRLRKSLTPTPTGFFSNSLSDERYHAQRHDETILRLDEIGFDAERIETRLSELDTEWNVDRAMKVAAGALAVSGLTLALVHNRRWLTLPLLAIGFLFQQSSTGWNPGRPGLRSLGYRTAEEIEEERKLLLERRNLANADKRKLQ